MVQIIHKFVEVHRNVYKTANESAMIHTGAILLCSHFDQNYRGYGLCCYIVWPSFLFECFVKIWATWMNFLGKCFTAPPPRPKIARTLNNNTIFSQLFTHPLSKHANLPQFYSKILCETEHLISVTLSFDEDDRSDIRQVISSS